MEVQTGSTTNRSERSGNISSAVAYLSILPALVLLVLPPYSKRANVRFHACQSILLNAALIGVLFDLGLFTALEQILHPGDAASLSLRFVWTARIVCPLVWAFCAACVAKGNRFRLPVFGAYAEKQAAKTLFGSSWTSVSEKKPTFSELAGLSR